MAEKILLERNIKEACGIFGIISRDSSELARKVYFGLFALQHRGQESAGIAVSYQKDKAVYYKNMGLVNDVFKEAELELLPPTTVAVGHVRYSTTGSSNVVNAQPVVFYGKKGRMAVAHNGNVVNANQIKAQMLDKGHIFQSSIDSEVIAARINYHIKDDLVGGIVAACEEFLGAFSLLVMAEGKLVAVRDRHGLKPLIIGKTPEGEIVAASESCALDAIGAEIVRDVKPGEVLVIDENLEMQSRFLKNIEPKFCIFEYVYISRSDSVLNGVSVYEARYKCGRMLAELFKIDADLVAGVPDSALVCAKGYSDVSGIPMVDAISKNRYVGRTFIKPKQSSRESSVRIKLNVLTEAVKGKRVIMIDDSIVRGTTSDRIVGMLREAGAKEVHVRISSPPFLHPCYFGTDIPSEDQLIAHNRSVDEICKIIGADSLAYLDEECLYEMSKGLGICTGCFNGKYPLDPPTEDIRGDYQK